MWVLADVVGLFSIIVGPFSRNVGPSASIFSANLGQKSRCYRAATPSPPPSVSRLTKLELQTWLDSAFLGGKPVHFFSSNGERFCCEFPNISVEPLPQQRVRIAVDGWEPKQYTASYTIEDDGTIAVIPGSAYPFPRLQGDEVTQVFVVRGNANNLFLERPLRQTNTPVTQRLWPLVFIAGGDWRPPPPKPTQPSA